MSHKKNFQKYTMISIAGLGISIGALTPVIPLPALVMFGVGMGIMLGGVFKGLYELAERME
ncbi:hypothetical protein CYPRO_0426 [Cyclonatronum proteinivorum]|uniref:Uncharacterized protein n=1 Tax=Cyclonatronum proteinivorum TaxID=1457365 RepID=A0A345UGW1_9BACT|nr:hypothetical protein CYPRO_0426 [Cyclonatronum proteinivorum]